MADEQEAKSEESFPKSGDEEAASASNFTATKAEEPGKAVGAGDRKRMTSESSLSEDTTAELQQTCRDAFTKIAEYLNGELTGSLDDYELLEKLNNLTTSKYQEMSSIAKTLITSMDELDEKYKSLQPYLEHIDKVEESVASLEQAAYRLDAYSKKLEARFKRLEKR